MKELSIEEKAKAYDEAIKVAKSKIKNDKDHVLYEEDITDIFPELSESRDERIRKEIISAIEEDWPGHTDWIAWLKSKGRKKPEVKYVYTKFRIGDVIVEIKPNGYCPPVTVKHISEGAYSCESDDGKRSLSFPITRQDEYKLVEQKPAENKGMNLVEEEMTPFQKKVFCIIDTTIEEEQGLKQVCDELLRLAHDEIIQSLKDRVQPQPQWKPTKKQIMALRWVLNHIPYDIHKEEISGLFDQIKEL